MREELLRPEVEAADDAELTAEVSLRPRTLAEFVGQAELKGHLEIILEAARRRSQAVDHVLLAGPPGLGKTSLAGIVASEMGVAINVTSGPAIERAGDLAAMLSQLGEGRRPLHRRDPPPPPGGGGGPLPGHGGLPDRHRPGQGPGGPVDPPRPAALHPGRCHHPHRIHHRARSATASAWWPASTTTSRPTSRPSSPGRRASSTWRSHPTGPTRSPAGPGAPHASPTACCAGCATSPR